LKEKKARIFTHERVLKIKNKISSSDACEPQRHRLLLALLLLVLLVTATVAAAVAALLGLLLLLVALLLPLNVGGRGAIPAAELVVVVVVVAVVISPPLPFLAASRPLEAPLPRIPGREDVRLVQPGPILLLLVPSRERQRVVVNEKVVFRQDVPAEPVRVAPRAVDEVPADGVRDLDRSLGVRDVELVAPLEGVLLRVPMKERFFFEV
jgi:hypothetical protein